MILSVLLVKRRVVSDVTPLESFLKELNTETDEWIKVLLACSDEKRIGGKNPTQKLPAQLAIVVSPVARERWRSGNISEQ